MDADLVLEGGGIKGIALVGAYSVLHEAGYRIRRVAGTSAGAVVGSLIAADVPLGRLRTLMKNVDYGKFQDKGFLDHLGLVGKSLSLLFEKGVYEGDYLRDWLDGILAGVGKRTFGDLKLDPAESGLPPSKSYCLVVMASDVSRGELVRLPWDYPKYGLDPDRQLVADAVRASISIPFFYEPVRLMWQAEQRDVVSYLVDGGILSNFPVDVFERAERTRPRRPAFGIKLSAKPDSALKQRFEIRGTLGFALALVGTMATWHDQMHIDDPCVADRTIFVDTTGVRATDFSIDERTERRLYRNGRDAARKFLDTWDFEGWLNRCGASP